MTNGMLDDEELLDRFLGADELVSEEAFRALVLRHGPSVLGVCRQILRRDHDAEDAFQATFLVLVRRVSSIRNRRTLGAWLNQVAYRTAIRAKARAARRQRQEQEAIRMSLGGQRSEPVWDDLGPVLHEEVHRLPESYRSAVVLCYLEGRTHQEAAALLHWPIGTVKGRLSRAREVLRNRLARRGLALSMAMLMSRLPAHPASAEFVSPVLAETTVQGAVTVTRDGPPGATAIPTRVLELVHDELARKSGFAILTTVPAFRWLLVLAAVLTGLSVALAGGSRAAYRIVAGSLTTPAGGGPGGCHHAR